jgi:phospholipid/cholesterol/gamma-HCH transport system substrate-binding protein
MKDNAIEAILGAVVILVAAVFLVFAYRAADLRQVQGYAVDASFTQVDGINAGTDVKIAGVTIGSVQKVSLDPESYTALVTLTLDPSVKLPIDSVVRVASSGLLGDRYLTIERGVEEEMAGAGTRILGQSTPGLEQLLGQLIFSFTQNRGGDGQNGANAPAATDGP